MGQESLERLNIQKYLNFWEKNLTAEYDKQFIKDHFKIGVGADKGKIAFYVLYLKTFCTDSCELSEWIWKKINGFLEDPLYNEENGTIKSMKYTPIQNITNIYNSSEKWRNVEW